MSFILDALRKSEKRRPEGTVPDLQSDHLSPGSSPRRRSLLPFLLLVALLVNAGLLLWWLAPWKSQPAQQIALAPGSRPEKAEPTAPLQNEESNDAVIAKTFAEPSQDDHLDDLQTASTAAKESDPAVGQTVIVPAEPHRERTIAPVVAPPRGTSGSDVAVDTAAPAVQEKSGEPVSPPPENASAARTEKPAFAPAPILALADLPSSVKSGLPHFDFSLHYYTSDPNQRMVRINGLILREGQQLTDGLLLDEITAEGAIFAYRDLRFAVVRY